MIADILQKRGPMSIKGVAKALREALEVKRAKSAGGGGSASKRPLRLRKALVRRILNDSDAICRRERAVLCKRKKPLFSVAPLALSLDT